MEEKELGAATLSPLRLLERFSQGRLMLWIAVAALVHVVLIGLLSVGYIRDRWIDPEGAAVRKAAAAAAREALKKEASVVSAPSVSAGAAPLEKAGGSAVTTGAGTGSGSTEQILDARKDTPVVKRITEAATREEIPSQPDDLDLSIGDTDKR